MDATTKPSWVSELHSKLGDQVVTDPLILEKYSHDASSHPWVEPQAVVFPTETAEVVKLMQFASANQVSVTVRGAGTGLEGNAVPISGGIVLSLERKNKLIKVFAADLQAVIEPGIIGDKLNQQLLEYSLFFPAFPASSSIATLGGMIANNAGGMYAVKYGVVGDWVLQLEVVLADGTVIKTGSRSVKSVAGYDLKRLFIGSEGTLGIITQATVRLAPVVTSRALIRASFPSAAVAIEATMKLIKAQLAPAALEYLDAASVGYINQLTRAGWDEQPTVLIEFHASSATIDLAVAAAQQLIRQMRAGELAVAKTPAEIAAVWQNRKAVHTAIRAAHPEVAIIHGDIGVPISKIPQFIDQAEKITAASGLVIAVFGHIGDGNIHVWLLYDPKNAEQTQKAKQANTHMVEVALLLGGTCTAEHGVGIGKKDYLAKEHPTSLPLMRSLKQLFDPHNILNPGKIL